MVVINAVITFDRNRIERRNSRFLQSPNCATNCLQHVHSKDQGCNRVQIMNITSRAYHVQHVVCHVVRRDRSSVKFDRVEIAFNSP